MDLMSFILDLIIFFDENPHGAAREFTIDNPAESLIFNEYPPPDIQPHDSTRRESGMA